MGKNALPSCGWPATLIVSGRYVTAYITLPPAGTSTSSGPEKNSLLSTGRKLHALLLALCSAMVLVSDARTAHANDTASGCALVPTHAPVSVRRRSGPPSTVSRTRSARTSRETSLGSNTTSSLTSWPGARYPSVGKMLKCGPHAAASHVKRAPTSPVFSSASRLTARDPSTTGPNGTLSLARLSSVPRHAPATRSSGTDTPPASTATSSSNARMRSLGRKRSVTSADSRGRSVTAAPGSTSTHRRRSRSALGEKSNLTGALPRLTTDTVRDTVWPAATPPKLAVRRAGSAASRRSVAPSPTKSTCTQYSPLTSSGTCAAYGATADGLNVMRASRCAPGASTPPSQSSCHSSVFVHCGSTLTAAASLLRSTSVRVAGAMPGWYTGTAPKSARVKDRSRRGLWPTPLRPSV
mmetsp:Transcript_20704/g.61796  ORF Transcript_20704/g.61796 Transcript_20704/m.61796 type:complete len:410 (-) Transcript_20704:2551-3780(-)